MSESASQPIPFHCVSIIGVGLLGASLGLALKEKKLATKIIGVGRSGSLSLPTALARGAIDEGCNDPAIAAAQSDLIILATNISLFPDIFRAIAGHLQTNTLITDVGSTKEQVCQWARRLLPPKTRFVGSHPMAGSEKRGPEFARADLYVGALCFICASRTTRIQSPVDRIDSLWRQIGMRTLHIEPKTHDQWVAAISHTPHAVAAALINLIHADSDALLQAVAGGFLDTTRVASGEPDMWTDIFLTNHRATTRSLKQFIGVLKIFESAVRRRDEAAIRAFLTQAKTIRDQLVHQRAGK